MTWLPDSITFLWFSAFQFLAYGIAWAICSFFVKFERKRLLFLSSVMLASGALLLTFSDEAVPFLWVSALYYLLGLALNILVVIFLLKRFETLLYEQNRHDDLTGLANRRALDRVLVREWRRMQRSGIGFAVLAMDLDHFKEVNDRFGHSAGDQMLIQVAGRLKRAAREVDMIARVGGEEFIALIHGQTMEGAEIAAERLRVAIAAAPYAFKDGLAPITISIGVALARSDDKDIAEVLERADQALYQAKHEGRNRVFTEAGSVAVSKPIAT
jgi:diguanylate cyclase (GGDEF)-like protein